jgi:hypothetical protein
MKQHARKKRKEDREYCIALLYIYCLHGYILRIYHSFSRNKSTVLEYKSYIYISRVKKTRERERELWVDHLSVNEYCGYDMKLKYL